MDDARTDPRHVPEPETAPSDAGDGSAGGHAGNGSGRWPASASQRWFFQADRVTPADPRFVMGIVVRVRGRLDVDLLDRSYDELVARHHPLRARLVKEDGAIWQHVEPHRPVALHRWSAAATGDNGKTSENGENRENRPGEDSTGDEEALIEEWTSWPVPFGEPPIVRGFVAERAADHHLVGLTFHHGVVDPRSLVIAMRDLARIYTARLAGRTPAPLPIAYGEYAAWQQGRLAPRLRADRRAWVTALAGLRPPRYRRDHPFVPGRPPVERELRAPLLLSAEELDAVERWSWRRRSTTFCSLLAAFARTCAEWTEARDLPISTVFEQRDHPSVRDDLIGPFIHGTLLRVRVEDGEAWPDFVGRVREVVTAAYSRAHISLLEVMLRAPHLLPGTRGGEPSWCRTFQYIPTDLTETLAFGEATGEVVRTTGPMPRGQDHGVHLWVQRAAGGGLDGRLVYDSSELTEASARSLLTHWVATVHDLLSSP